MENTFSSVLQRVIDSNKGMHVHRNRLDMVRRANKSDFLSIKDFHAFEKAAIPGAYYLQSRKHLSWKIL